MNTNAARNIVTILGLAFWWPFLRNSITGFAFAGNFNMLLFVCTGILAGLIAARIGLWTSKLGAYELLVMLTCFLSSAANAMAIGFPNIPVLAHIAAALFALCYVALPLAWMFLLRQSYVGHNRHLLVVLLSSYALSFVIGYLSYLPIPFSLIRPIGAPLISGLCWLLCSRRAPFHLTSTINIDNDTDIARYRIFYPTILILLALSGIPLAFVDGGTVLYQPNFLTLVRDTLNIVLIGFLTALVALSRHSVQTRLPLLLLFSMFTLIGMAIASVLTSNGFILGIGVLATGKASLAMLLFVLACLENGSDKSIVHRCILLFVIPTLLSTFLHTVAIPVLCSTLHISSESFWGTVSLLFAGALSICLLGLLSSIAIRSEQATGSLTTKTPSYLIDDFANRYSLSERETTVLELLLKGNTFKKIAQIMHLSDSTIQSHSKSIYRKANVHTKQELIDLVYSATNRRG